MLKAASLLLVLTSIGLAADPSVRPAATQAASTRPAERTIAISTVDADGRAVADVSVVFVPAPPKVDFYFVFDGNLRPRVTYPYKSVRTDESGHAQLPCRNGPGSIVAFGEAGWARLAASDIHFDTIITIRHWGAVTGRLMVGNRPSANRTVMILPDWTPAKIMADRAMITLSTRTNADGRFSFAHVPPEALNVADLTQSDGISSGGQWANSESIKLKPGEHRDVLLGGTGRPVVGTITLPPDVNVDGLRVVAYLDHRVPTPPLPRPANITNGTDEEREAWLTQFKKTKAFAEWQASVDAAMRASRSVPARWTAPLAFQSDDVQAGDYSATVEFLNEKGAVVLRSDKNKLTIPPMPSGRSDEPLTIPAVTLHRVTPRVRVGEPAVDFTVTSLDGRPIRLSDYRGRVVLLDFWATWCPPCVAGIPNLRKAYDQFKDSGRFAILSVSYDETAAHAKAYVDAQHLSWEQAWCGDPIPPAMNEGYAGGLPTMVLIGPDGKVLSADLDGDQLIAAIAEALRARD